jgi:hypothetical protein
LQGTCKPWKGWVSMHCNQVSDTNNNVQSELVPCRAWLGRLTLMSRTMPLHGLMILSSIRQGCSQAIEGKAVINTSHEETL